MSDGAGGWTAPTPPPPPPPGWSAEQPPPAPVVPGGYAGGGWPTYAAPPAPKPGIVQLRPLGVGEILDGAFTAMRRYPRPTLGFAAVLMLILGAVQVITQWALLHGVEPPPAGAPGSQVSSYLGRVGSATTIVFLVLIVLVLVLTGLVTAVIGEGVIGRPITTAQAWARVRPLLWRLVGATALVFLIPTGIYLACFVPGILLAVGGSGSAAAALLVIGGIAGTVLGIWQFFRLAFAPSVVILEKQTVRGALRRSRALVRGSWWRVFGIWLLVEVIAVVVGFVVQIPFAVASGGLSLSQSSAAPTFTQLVISAIGGFLSGTVVRPFQAGAMALLYIDRRIRAEALDVALARAAAEPPVG